MAHKRASKATDVADDDAITPLQAVLLADSFAQKFRPITLERPKVLLPLVNVPMIEYTLQWLASGGVKEVFVFCCSHANQVISYLERYNWKSQPNFNVIVIESHDCVSAGDAMRLIDQQGVVRGDFVLVSGDTVSNMSLKEVVEQHQERRKQDKQAVMTLVVKRSKPNPLTHQSRLGNNELVLAINPNTKQLLYYDAGKDSTGVDATKPDIALDWSLFSENPAVQLCIDLQDCHIDICSPEVLHLFTDNFDYQQLRRDFVRGVLGEYEVTRNKIFTYEISGEYAARIDNLRGYDVVAQDIIHRWAYPLVSDSQLLKHKNGARVTVDRRNVYKADGVVLARTAVIGESTVVGEGTTVGENTLIRKSVVGRGCTIGRNVIIEGSHIWDNVIVHDNAKLYQAVVCDGAVIKTEAVLEPGVVLSFNVVIGPNFVVPEYSKVSLLPQPTEEDSSDEELEYVDSAIGSPQDAHQTEQQTVAGSASGQTGKHCEWDVEEVGVTGAGYRWSIKGGGQEEEWRHSVAPIPRNRVREILLKDEQLEIEAAVQDDGTAIRRQGDNEVDSEVDDDEDQEAEDDFDTEVEETFKRAMVEGITQENVVIEVNSLKLAYNRSFSDCAGALFKALLNLALEAPHQSANELLNSTAKVLTRWGPLLKKYVKAEEEEVEVLLVFEEVCLESHKEFASIFSKVLAVLYDKDLISETSIITWAEEKTEADESDRVFLNQCQDFIKWLQEAEEDDSDDEVPETTQQS